jgi:hypothetical protein
MEVPAGMTLRQFSLQTLDSAAATGRPVVFDLTHMQDIPGGLSGSAYPNAYTTMELQHIQSNWNKFSPLVQFMQNGKPVNAPW